MTLRQMVDALVRAVENPADGVRVMDVEAIRGGAPKGRNLNSLRLQPQVGGTEKFHEP